MTDAEIRTTDPMTVAFLQMRGSYDQTPEGFERLYKTVEHYGLQPVAPPHSLYVTMPDVTPEGQAEWELWAPIAGGAGSVTTDEEGFGVKRIEPKLVAATRHVGPYDALSATYAQLQAWIADHSYEVIGPPEEVYHSEPGTAPEETVTEVLIPVRRL